MNGLPIQHRSSGRFGTEPISRLRLIDGQSGNRASALHIRHSMIRGSARYSECVADDRLILITLLVKLGVAAAVASALARSRTFQRLLFAERRRHRQTAALLAFFLVPLTLGVYLRFAVPNFLAADISFE